MQLGLVVLVLVMLSSLCSSSTEDHHAQPALPRRHRRGSTEGAPPCPKGCERCSEYNGCVKCKPKLFIFLERNDIRQIGVCLASCPMGYFGMRNPETNRCTQCKIENCEACFNRNFCTKCQEGFYSHRGRCHMTCPPGLASTNGTMECIGQPVAECELSDWSTWSPCMKKNKTCGFKNGSQERLRTPLPPRGPEGPLGVPPAPRPCGPQTERKKCLVVKTPCPRGRKNKGERRHEPSARGERENGRGRGRDGREGRGGGGGGGTKRRKAQSQVSPTPSPAASPTPSPTPSTPPGSVG